MQPTSTPISGHTKAWYARSFTYLGHEDRFLLSTPSVLRALDVIFGTWSFQSRCLLMVIPRYLCLKVSAMFCSSTV